MGDCISSALIFIDNICTSINFHVDRCGAALAFSNKLNAAAAVAVQLTVWHTVYTCAAELAVFVLFYDAGCRVSCSEPGPDNNNDSSSS